MGEDLLEAARTYAAWGLGVLPLLPGSKIPAYLPQFGLGQGYRSATRDPGLIDRLWTLEPEFGVGVVPPPPIVVLDLDGPEWAASITLLSPGLVRGARARTRRGVHLWARWPQRWPFPGPRSGVIQGVPLDLKGMGTSYLVAPPTPHPAGRYTWVRPLPETPEGLPEVDERLVQLILSQHPVRPPPPEGFRASPDWAQRFLDRKLQELRGVPAGTRHQEMVRAAVAVGHLVREGALGEEAWARLEGAGLEMGLPPREIRGVLRWARKL